MDASQYKCPNCSAELNFDPVSQQLKCDFCRSEFTMARIKEIYAELEQEMPAPDVTAAANQEFESHTNLYHCASCGADIMADDNTTATFCYYCHSPVILSGKLVGSFRPDRIIGFRLTRENAVDAFQKWVKKRYFVPSDFKSRQQMDKITGLYVPFWVADCDVRAEYSGIGKQVRSWTSGNYRYTETKEFSVERCAKVITRGIPADGESKIDDLLMESIEPYNYNDLKDFSMSYMTGFFADKYDVDKAAVFPRIRNRAIQAGNGVIQSSISGYSSVSALHQNYSVEKTNWQYIMLPVWFMTYNYKGQLYEFAINGQTGKLAGTPPLDKKKLRLFSALIALAVTILVFLFGGAA